MDIVPADDGGKKRGIEVDRKIRKLDGNSIGRRKRRPVIRCQRRFSVLSLYREDTRPIRG